MDKETKRIITGKVQRASLHKTGVISVERIKIHPKYKKSYKVTKKYLFHDEVNVCKTGDTASIIESRRYSKRKAWRLLENVAADLT